MVVSSLKIVSKEVFSLEVVSSICDDGEEVLETEEETTSTDSVVTDEMFVDSFEEEDDD